MTDTLSVHDRSLRMSRVRSKDSVPEVKLRSIVHKMGFRFRLHGKSLPGKPDLVFASRRAVIFMHGCFWHRHDTCRLARLPKSKLEFWRTKLNANRKRDKLHEKQLLKMGWRVLVVWECELERPEVVAKTVKRFLEFTESL